MKKFKLVLMLMVSVFILAACGATEDELKSPADERSEEMDSGSEKIEHSDSGEVPTGLEEATDPTYEVGSKAMITTDHMDGMEGAEATIVGAYDTRAYIISYTPTNGDEKVEDHKWVIQEEIEDAGDEKIESGKEVTVEADHMEGMEGAKSTIESSEETTVYMIDYESTTDGEEVKNHKWVTEDELEDE